MTNDDVWSSVVDELARKDRVRPSDIAVEFPRTSSSEIERVLDKMADSGWLERDGEWFEAGVKIELLRDLDGGDSQ